MSYSSKQKKTGNGKSSKIRKDGSLPQKRKRVSSKKGASPNQSIKLSSAIRQRNHAQLNSKSKRRSSSTNKKQNRKKKNNGCLKWLFFFVLIIALIILILTAIKGCSKQFSESISPTVWSEEVKSYQSLVEEKAKQYGIEEYTGVLLSIMMQESKGLGTDPMQSSECIHNTRYERVPNGIKDPEYSIDCGIQYFADALNEANCKGINDTNVLMLAIQGYNYGHGYISWALQKEGGYSKENAELFSREMEEELDWSSYGDPEYVVKVLNYYYASSE